MGYHVQLQQQAAKGGSTDERHTRRPDFELVEKLFGVRFTLDVCAVDAKASKCQRFYAPRPTPGCLGVDGLAQPWGVDEAIFDNPPWSDIGPWVLKHWRSSSRLSVAYLPNDRAERSWWSKYVEPFLATSLRYNPIAAARANGFDLHGLRFTATNLDYRPCFDVPGGGSAGEAPMCGVVVLGWDRR